MTTMRRLRSTTVEQCNSRLKEKVIELKDHNIRMKISKMLIEEKK